jgi:hypothetical protein
MDQCRAEKRRKMLMARNVFLGARGKERKPGPGRGAGRMPLCFLRKFLRDGER